MMNLEAKDYIAFIREYANDNYENGWDVVVEAWSDANIIPFIDYGDTNEEVLAKIKVDVDRYNEYRDELRATEF